MEILRGIQNHDRNREHGEGDGYDSNRVKRLRWQPIGD